MLGAKMSSQHYCRKIKDLAHGICESIWIRRLLEESKPMRIYCDNKAAIPIAHNPIHSLIG